MTEPTTPEPTSPASAAEPAPRIRALREAFGGKRRRLLAFDSLREPWERQPNEPFKAFAAFGVFLRLGPGRKQAQVAEQQQRRSKRTLEDWSVAWRWVERAGLWDAHLAEAARRAEQDERERQARAIVTMARNAGQLGELELRKHYRRAADASKRAMARHPQGEDDSAPALSTDAAWRLIEGGVKLERLIRGQSTENTASTVTAAVAVRREEEFDYSRLTDSELDAFERLLRKLQGEEKPAAIGPGDDCDDDNLDDTDDCDDNEEGPPTPPGAATAGP